MHPPHQRRRLPDGTTVTIRDPRYLIGNDKTRMLEFQIRIATAETNIDRQHAAMDLAAWLILAFHDPSLDIPLPEAPLNIELAVLEEVRHAPGPYLRPGTHHPVLTRYLSGHPVPLTALPTRRRRWELCRYTGWTPKEWDQQTLADTLEAEAYMRLEQQTPTQHHKPTHENDTDRHTAIRARHATLRHQHATIQARQER